MVTPISTSLSTLQHLLSPSLSSCLVLSFPFDPCSQRLHQPSLTSVISRLDAQVFALSVTFSHPFFASSNRLFHQSLLNTHVQPLSPPSLWWLIPSVTRLSHTGTKPSHFHHSINLFKREQQHTFCGCELSPERRGESSFVNFFYKCHGTNQQ